MNDGLGNGEFARHKALIEYRFDQLDKGLAEISLENKELRADLVQLKLKVAAFGGASGLLGWAIPQLIKLMAH